MFEIADYQTLQKQRNCFRRNFYICKMKDPVEKEAEIWAFMIILIFVSSLFVKQCNNGPRHEKTETWTTVYNQ